MSPRPIPKSLRTPARGGFVAFLLVFGLLGCAFAAGETGPKQRAPDFTLKDVQGNTVRLADFSGQALIVSFVVTWDKPSLRQIGILSDIRKERSEKELAILAVAIEQGGEPTTKSYVEQKHPGFPFLVADYATISAFGGLTAVPTTFVIDKNHNIVQKYVGITSKDVLDSDLNGQSVVSHAEAK
ncbi:MAG TPA: TlpA disulfide reductase family protein [Verrucomicrobiae bacterium]|nr:TlpA disulfide reductase family protein [Verrucomicrobiae bacterium]